jgi:hypothetical protein
MTCADFRQLCERAVPGGPLPTRGERAALQAHLAGCDGCRNWLDARREIATDEEKEIARQKAGRIKERDMADPEFRNVTRESP